MSWRRLALNDSTNARPVVDWPRRLRRISASLAALLVLLGTVVLSGWVFDIEPLRTVSPRFVSMKANTALCFILAGTSILLLPTRHRWAEGVALALSVLGGLTLLQDVLGLDLRIDELLIEDVAYPRLTGSPGRMSPLTSTSFFLLGAAVLGLRRTPVPAQCLACLPGLLGYFAVGCYFMGLVPATRIESYTAVSFLASFGLVLSTPAIWLARPHIGLAVAFSDTSLAGRMARWLLPAAVAVPLFSGALTSLGSKAGWFSLPFGNAVIILLSCLLYCLLAWALVAALRTFQVERSDLKQSLGKAGKRIERKRRELEQFAFTISHDLKSPLVSIRGFLGLMLQAVEAGNAEEVKENAQDVDEAAQHMSHLIDDLLAYSRIGRAQPEEFEDVDMAGLLEDVVDLNRPQCEAAEAEVEIRTGVPSCTGHANSLHRAIENLVANALRYGKVEGRTLEIELGGEVYGDERRYFVRDNGPGIEPQYHERIFGLFQRIDTTNADGTGLGLASVAKVAENHGGRAWVESVPGEGATFWISILP